MLITNGLRFILTGLCDHGRESPADWPVWASILLSIAILLVFYGATFLLIFFPAKVLQFLARLWKKGWANGEVPDWIDNLMDPLSKFLVGSRKAFIVQGSIEPERFPRLIWAYRILGLVVLFGTLIPLLWILLTY
jgi:hypothetical protein